MVAQHPVASWSVNYTEFLNYKNEFVKYNELLMCEW